MTNTDIMLASYYKQGEAISFFKSESDGYVCEKVTSNSTERENNLSAFDVLKELRSLYQNNQEDLKVTYSMSETNHKKLVNEAFHGVNKGIYRNPDLPNIDNPNIGFACYDCPLGEPHDVLGEFHDAVIFSKINGEYVREFMDGITLQTSISKMESAEAVHQELSSKSQAICTPQGKIMLLEDRMKEAIPVSKTCVGTIAEFANFNHVVAPISKKGFAKAVEDITLGIDKDGSYYRRVNTVEKPVDYCYGANKRCYDVVDENYDLTPKEVLDEIAALYSSKEFEKIHRVSKEDIAVLKSRLPSQEVPFDDFEIAEVVKSENIKGLSYNIEGIFDLSNLVEEELAAKYELLKRSTLGRSNNLPEQGIYIKSFEDFKKYVENEDVQLEVEVGYSKDKGLFLKVSLNGTPDSSTFYANGITLTDDEQKAIEDLRREIDKKAYNIEYD